MRWAAPTFLFAVFAGAVGCSSLQTAKVVPPAALIRSVVSLSPGTTEILASSNVSSLLKGRTAADTARGIESVPVVASVKPDYEAIKKINPDLVLYDSLLYNSQDVQKIKDLGYRTYAIDSNTVADFEKQMYELGDLLNNQTGASSYVDRIDVAKASGAAGNPSSRLRVAVVMPGHGGSDMIVGTKSFVADAVKIAGGSPVGPPVDRFVPLNPEQMVSDNPDVIVVPTTAATAGADADAILHDPKLASTNAVKNKRIAAIESNVILRRGDSVDKLLTNLARSFAMGGKS